MESDIGVFINDFSLDGESELLELRVPRVVWQGLDDPILKEFFDLVDFLLLLVLNVLSFEHEAIATHASILCLFLVSDLLALRVLLVERSLAAGSVVGSLGWASVQHSTHSCCRVLNTRLLLLLALAFPRLIDI